MQIKHEAENPKQSPKEIVRTIFKVVPLAMGVAVVVLSVIDELPIQSGFIMLGIGMFCAGLALMNEKK